MKREGEGRGEGEEEGGEGEGEGEGEGGGTDVLQGGELSLQVNEFVFEEAKVRIERRR